ncbi:helix-turn-helix transcriptional regulator [Allosaccharopolyspora coralli]|uniref:helix-turn-helix transcriptional regulator n=1 Tax=Allosaccharopolyspora coralli TaxID=2665642 RepID=UPI001E3A5B8D|nr:helix-turn-helix transcriptional regulator [Allosaccharopolyspora coralli]
MQLRGLRRAVAFIEANPDLDLTLTDIARAANVSPRALQLAFRRHLDTTPMHYLRRVRLDRAHHDLQNAVAGDGTTVTGVAARWGYARPSRFAADYRSAYGEHPHRTLHTG